MGSKIMVTTNKIMVIINKMTKRAQMVIINRIMAIIKTMATIKTMAITSKTMATIKTMVIIKTMVTINKIMFIISNRRKEKNLHEKRPAKVYESRRKRNANNINNKYEKLKLALIVQGIVLVLTVRVTAFQT